MKLKKEDYLKIAKLVDEGKSFLEIAFIYKTGRTYMHNLVRRYQMHGVDALLCKGNWRNFSPEYKKEIIDRHYSGASISSLAIEINVCDSVIRSWIKKYEDLGYNGLINNRGRPGVTKVGRPRKNQTKPAAQQAPLTDPEREELNELRKRTRRLEMELEATKKLQSLVQERIKRQTPKK